jgi:uncharacterized membrane protein
MAGSELVSRLDRVEAELRALQAEVTEVRRLATGAGASAVPVGAPTQLTPAAAMQLAWAAFERGRQAEAVEHASVALRLALEKGDPRVLGEVRSFIRLAEPVVDMPLRARLSELVVPATAGEPAPRPSALPFPMAVPRPAATVPPETVAEKVAPAGREGPSAGERLVSSATSELSGARGFALVGGIVTLLGIVFLFVLAANRGWIGPVARVSIGAVASLAVFLGGVVLRVRFGRMQASLAAVGTGIAGAYVTLAAAAIIYQFLPNWAALLVAAAIATAGAGLGWLWLSQILAGLSLVGAAAAPALVALDDGIGAAGTAFAVIVLGAALVAGAARRWLWFGATVGVISLAQLAWLTVAASSRDAGALAVAAAAALLLLGASAAWQATSSASGLDSVAGSMALLSGGVALSTLVTLLPDNREAGIALATGTVVYGAAGFVIARLSRDLGWVIGAVALLFAGVATSLLLSERSLTVAWAVEAAALAALAWRLGGPRFELASLVYVALGIGHLLAIDIWIDKPIGDLAGFATPGMSALATAALVMGTLAIDSRRDGPSAGVLAPLEPVWDGIVAARGSLRFWLYAASVLLAAFATAGILSGGWLTIAWLAAGVVLGAGAWRLGERRMQAAGLTLFMLAAVHALLVDAQPRTLWIGRGLDPLRPVPSLAALASAAALLAAVAIFGDRGIAFLGPLAGEERQLAWIGRKAPALRAALLTASLWYAVWAAGLLLVHASYGTGQAAATGLWAATGAGMAAFAARRRSTTLALAAIAPTLLAFGKATAFDWHELGSASSVTALLLAAAGVLLLGFFSRYAASDVAFPIELGSLGTAVVAVVSAFVAIDRVAPDRRVLGAAALGVAAIVAGLAVPPFLAWRRGGPEKWSRDLATVYWAVGLVTLGFAEWALVAGNVGQAATVWALSSALVATCSGALGESRFWFAGAAGAALATLVCLADVTVPARLVASSAHPGAGLWALAACIAAIAWIGRLATEVLPRACSPIALVAVALTVFGLSLGVLEIAERVSGASIATDFQRGHTGVSALWGLLALGLIVYGLIRSERLLQRAGLALFGVALAKLFLYDLQNLSSITRALSFLAVGAILLTAAFFIERIVHDSDGPGPGGRAGPMTV